MKQWTVTYREKSGVKTSVVIEAEDRAGVFAELKNRGINAISITEGAVKAKRRAASGGGVSKGVWGVVVAVVVAALLGVVWMVMPKDEKPIEVKKVEKKEVVQEESPSVTLNNRSGEDSAATNVKNQVSEIKRDDENLGTWLGVPVVKKDVITNGVYVVSTYYTKDGKSHKHYHNMRDEILPSGVDQLLAIMTQDDDGLGAPPLPLMTNLENEIADALKSEIVIKESDSADIKAMKERVKRARKELIELMAQGVAPEEIVKEYNRIQEYNAQVRLVAVQDVKELLEAGRREEARIVADKYNVELQKLGLMIIELPEE